MEVVGQRLKALREGVGLSQNKLAKMMGLRQSSINRYEAGESTPSPENLLWYADYFDVSLDYIFGRTENPQGKGFDYRPRTLDEKKDMKEFVDMCFDPKSPMNERLKAKIIEMLGEVEA